MKRKLGFVMVFVFGISVICFLAVKQINDNPNFVPGENNEYFNQFNQE